MVLCDYINATITFDRLAAKSGKAGKSLPRLPGPKGNPTAANVFAILVGFQDAEGVRFAMRPAAAAR